ncbi:diguanylate cyclase domain-containing protein [Solibacillus sp. R5-41]|uniref:diguanylate cyclase domain-containing protein n=1 Tax=Solibacillus sp. R5-41 TaxID=2048654 RepID=UPI0012FD8342|nr:diguanylate cyclase [Solibacillus sp. R5-41]
MNLLLVFLMFIIIGLALFNGTLNGLVASLLLIFLIGTTILIMSVKNTTFSSLQFQMLSIEQFFIFGVALIVSVVVAGNIHERISEVMNDRKRLRYEVEQFVSIDTDTSFDNKKRMQVEIKREMSRVNRHGGSFSLLLVELDHYKEFNKAYGSKEMQHLLMTIGQKANELLRTTDRKFRYLDNRFAFLLTETPKAHVEIIIEKLSILLQTHQLTNGKTVTLSFHISFNEYDDLLKQHSYEQFIEELESELIYYAM